MEGDNITIPSYPIIREDSQGKPVLVMKARGQYSYIGNFIVDFDIAGNVVGWESTRNEPSATTEEAITAMADRLNETTNGPVDEVA